MIFQLDENELVFPHPSLADEDGLLAVGGDLRTERLLLAYENAIFPWYSEDTPILWYAPHDRFVLYPQRLKISKSMQQVLRSRKFRVSCDTAFDRVIQYCASVSRKDQDGTWIVDDMQQAYSKLHREGFAHSIEVWQGEELVGGLYGVQVGKVFCGESMFSLVSNASKVALIFLAQRFGLELIDCQIPSEHLERMGAETISQKEYLHILEQQENQPYAFQAAL
ncbi:leucyl/phenylalanyl-tRNA--protein transferase [Sphingobacterium lactis]|uniref:Leucyl/phenylalanyl-tRNA--protein transferase n=1 Tax=Sphingobacterium lactis TaxID=797291 RepID=A0A1H5S0Z3_9SPHI|nr:leucyl/phenylalanyl-tRNA--protein transferase [Sphingobacterium lactis]SEF43507.1 leucyl/phenylalanyl-tRNA--protein transferase [Sphingobacterium lactis]